MFETLITTALQSQGVWAGFAVALVFYVMAASARREAKLLDDASRREQLLMNFAEALSDKIGLLADRYQSLCVEVSDLKRDVQRMLEEWR